MRTRESQSLGWCAALVMLMLTGPCFGDNTPRYTLVDLGLVGGAQYSVANAINEKGEVVGQADTGAVVKWRPNGGKGRFIPAEGAIQEDLNIPPPRSEDLISLPDTHAILWQGDQAQFIGPLQNYHYSSGVAINAAGEVLGQTDTTILNGKTAGLGYRREGFWWTQGHATTVKDGQNSQRLNDLHQMIYETDRTVMLLNGGRSQDVGLHIPNTQNYWSRDGVLNNIGEVAGEAMQVGGSDAHLFLWDGAICHDLGDFPDGIKVTGLNNNGCIVGDYLNSPYMAFMTDAQGKPVSLGVGPFMYTYAKAVNNLLQIVGVAHPINDGAIVEHAALWDKGQWYDLNNLLPPHSDWVLMEARGINDQGQIVGYGLFHGKTRAFLLNPM